MKNINTTLNSFLNENATNDAKEYALRDKIEPYVKELHVDYNKKEITFLPNDEEDRTLYRITVGLYELNYHIRRFDRRGDLYIWKW